MIFGRVKSLDAILATAQKKGLHRSLGAFQLTLLGIGAVIGTGIFVLTSEAAQKAGPGMMLSIRSWPRWFPSPARPTPIPMR
jgi:APA family basic amino acid/polyamine antiporter